MRYVLILLGLIVGGVSIWAGTGGSPELRPWGPAILLSAGFAVALGMATCDIVTVIKERGSKG
jgi:hypothetical protein